MPSLVATTSTPARKPFVRTHYVRTNNNLFKSIKSCLCQRDKLHFFVWLIVVIVIVIIIFWEKWKLCICVCEALGIKGLSYLTPTLYFRVKV